jgi:hypothetical protein
MAFFKNQTERDKGESSTEPSAKNRKVTDEPDRHTSKVSIHRHAKNCIELGVEQTGEGFGHYAAYLLRHPATIEVSETVLSAATRLVQHIFSPQAAPSIAKWLFAT